MTLLNHNVKANLSQFVVILHFCVQNYDAARDTLMAHIAYERYIGLSV